MRDLFRSRKTEMELDKELQFDMDERIREFVKQGLALDEARRRARLEFGGIEQIKEECRDAGTLMMIEAARSEFQFALRRLLKRPAASIAGVLTLAFGIGAAAATWSLLFAVLLHPLPVDDAQRLMVVGQIRPQTGAPDTVSNALIYPWYAYLRDSGTFERVAAQWMTPQPLSVNTDGNLLQTNVAFATYDFFDVLGVRMALGRGFTPDEDKRGALPAAVLTDRYWRRTFNADPGVIGKTIKVAGRTATIVGVAARGFRGLDLSQSPDFYLPFHTIADVGSSMTNYFAESRSGSSPTAGTMIVGRLLAGETAAQTSARLASLASLPGVNATFKLTLTDVNTAAVPAAARSGMSQFARLLAITVGLLLLIGCTTAGMLLLIRTEARRNELAMCLALGASRFRLVQGIVIEGSLLAAAGAVFALPVSWWMFWGARAFQLPGNVGIDTLDLKLDGNILMASVACAVVATAVISLVAGAFSFSAGVGDALRVRSGATPRLTHRRLRAALVSGQVAVALVLLAGAGLFTRSVIEALSLNSTLDMSHLVTGAVSLGPYGYDGPRAGVFFNDLFARLSANPSVRSIAFNDELGGMGGKLVVDGVPHQFPSFVPFANVDSHYFRTMGIPLIKGRDFSDDDRENAPLVVIVSESFGRQLADGASPVGCRIQAVHHKIGQPAETMEVVGVVGDVITNVAVLAPPAMYFPITQPTSGMGPAVLSNRKSIVVRAATDPNTTRREILSTIRQLDPRISPPPLITIEERIAGQMSSQRFGAYLMGVLGVIATLLTLLGTYALAESMAIQRLREMGVRAALGASRGQLATMVFGDTVRLVCIGLLAGLLLAWSGAGTIRAFLFRVRPLDPATLVTVAALILVLAIVVSLRPALRVARVDISRVLRDE